VTRSWVNWRLLAASCIQEEEMVGTSHGEKIGRTREHWLVQCNCKTLGRQKSHVEETNREERENGFITTH